MRVAKYLDQGRGHGTLCFLTCSSPGYSSLLIALVQLVRIKEIFNIQFLCCSFMIYLKSLKKPVIPNSSVEFLFEVTVPLTATRLKKKKN